MGVLARAREQQATEAGERPLPPEVPSPTIAQRTNYQRSGIEAKRLMYGIKKDSDVVPPRPVNNNKSHFKSPTDFYAGPTQPGRVTGGPRRYDGVNTDRVGYTLTDEYLNAPTDYGPVKPVGGPEHVDNSCYPVYAEPKSRAMVKQFEYDKGLDAPYFEDHNPKPPREAPKVDSIKSFPEKTNAPTGFIFPPAPQRSQPLHGNRKNESKDLLNLNHYSAAQLNEHEPHRLVGKVKWDAPAMDYPKRRPMIRQVNCSATQCHDVLGTERFGHRDEEEPRGVKTVDDYPYKDQEPLIAYVEPHKQEPRPVKQSNMLRYYDPSIDDISKFQEDAKPSGKAHPPNRRMNYSSNSHFVQGGGKGRGVYGSHNQSSIVLA